MTAGDPLASAYRYAHPDDRCADCGRTRWTRSALVAVLADGRGVRCSVGGCSPLRERDGRPVGVPS